MIALATDIGLGHLVADSPMFIGSYSQCTVVDVDMLVVLEFMLP